MNDFDLSLADIRSIARHHYANSFKAFVKDAWHLHHPTTPFIDNWHIDAICEHLEAQTRGEITRLIINVPPGAMKSFLAGVYWPTWEWLTNPSVQIVATAANEALAIRDNQRARWLIESDWYQNFCPIKLKADANASSKFINEDMGFRWAIPFTSITGFRADRIIVDDAISASNAHSDAKRNQVNSDFWTNIVSRLNDPKRSTITVIQQRLHEDDLVGNILSAQPDRWETLILPMEKTSFHHITKIGFSDPRKEGELLFPERWDEEEINDYKSRPYDWASQYQQDPAPTEDGLFKREWIDDNLFDRKDLPKDLIYYLATDHAVDEGSNNDYNVCLVLALDSKKDIYVVDSFRERCIAKVAMGIDIDEKGRLAIATKGALALAKKWKPHRWFAESDNNFKAIQSLVKDTMRATGVHVGIETVSPHGKSKAARTSALQGYASLGKIHFEKGSRLHADAIIEFLKFPVGKHDDIVDSLAVFCRSISEAHPAVITPTTIKGDAPDGYQRRSQKQKGRQHGFY